MRFFPQSRWRALSLLILCCSVSLLAGCDRSSEALARFHSIDITGAPYGHDFRLQGPDGRERSVADFRGKAILVFFGFTQCPDVCPTALTRAAEVKRLLPAVAVEAEGWKLLLQIGGALGDPALAAPYVERAQEEKAPPWAIAWTRAVSKDERERREGLVELLFSDAPLARTVAARDLAVPSIAAEGDATERYAAFAHGRDSIRRFGAATVAELVMRARTNPSGAAKR